MKLRNVKIVTDRLTLQRIEPKYAREIMAEFTDEITQYMFPKPPDSIDDVMQFITSSMNSTKAGNNLQLVVLKKQTKEFIGCVGLHHIGQKDPELGLWIKKVNMETSTGLRP